MTNKLHDKYILWQNNAVIYYIIIYQNWHQGIWMNIISFWSHRNRRAIWRQEFVNIKTSFVTFVHFSEGQWIMCFIYERLLSYFEDFIYGNWSILHFTVVFDQLEIQGIHKVYSLQTLTKGLTFSLLCLKLYFWTV